MKIRELKPWEKTKETILKMVSSHQVNITCWLTAMKVPMNNSTDIIFFFCGCFADYFTAQ